MGLPMKLGEVPVAGLDDSVQPAVVVAAVARVGGCRENVVRVGLIRSYRRGHGSAWVRYPLTVTRKVVEEGRLQLRWFAAARGHERVSYTRKKE